MTESDFDNPKKEKARPQSAKPASPESQDVPEPVEHIQKSVVMTEIDSYVHERVVTQPADISSVSVADPFSDNLGRLSLPEWLEGQSYDCTRGLSCKSHTWTQSANYSWNTGNRGKYVFKWVWKNKRSLDQHLNVLNWAFVTRRQFPEAPRSAFSANGGIEEGDNILMVMPVQQALALRKVPGRRSREMLNARLTKSDKKKNKMIMTGDLRNERYYEPETSSDESENDPASTEGVTVPLET